MKTKYILTIITLILGITIKATATNYTWVGNTSTSWNVSSNWNPSTGIPDSADNVTISTGTNNPTLDQNRKITNLTLTTKTINLAGYTLTTYGTATLTSGTITEGIFKARGTFASFNGTLMDCTVDAVCGYIRLSGSTFNQNADFTDNGTATGTGSGGCTFNDTVTITHTGTSTYFTLANVSGDTFNSLVTFKNTSTHELYVASNGSSTFNGNVILNSTSTGGIFFGSGTGTSTLATGKTILIGNSGFTADYLTLKSFTQSGSTAQTLTLTGTAVVNMISSTFNGSLTLTSPGFLLKNNTFNGTVSLNRSASSGNHQSDGGNTFNNSLTLNNSGSSGRIRMASTTADTYNGDATFNSTGGQDVQIAYSGDNIFTGNLTINSNKVVFNTASGKVTFSGDSIQTLNGNYNFQFKKLAINKSGSFITANSTLSVDDTLFFIKGTFLTKSTNELILKNGAKVTGASDSSYVEGPVKKIGNTGFIFPCGANNSYRPIEISAPSITTSEFIAEFKEDSLSVNTNTKDSTLARLLRNQYWNLNRTSGTSQVYVTLGWNPISSIVDTLITVASWNGMQWKDLGKGILSGNVTSGNIKSYNVSTTYSQFIIAFSGSSGVIVPPSCLVVSDVNTLNYCLTHANLAVVIGDIDMDAGLPALNLPLVIPVNFTLTSNTKWWEPDCPLIYSNHKSIFNEIFNTTADLRGLYLFAVEPFATVENLRFRGASCNYQDYNQDDMLCGGLYYESSTGAAAIRNCELACFSQSAIWKAPALESLDIENCYIHKVKGRADTGIGYGVWTQGNYNAIIPQAINFYNTIFDDCKTAIDGQAKITNWNIRHCSLTQFFSSEDINMHNDNRFTPYSVDNLGVITSDYNYCYNSPNCSLNECFFGIYSVGNTAPCLTDNGTTSYIYDDGWLNCSSDIHFYDVGGAFTTIENNIFHHKINLLLTNSNISLKFPNRVDSKSGSATNGMSIDNNIFATDELDPADDGLHDRFNRGGYARISQNYIESCIWEDPYISHDNNDFGYLPGKAVTGTNIQPCEVVLELLHSSNTILGTTYTSSASANHRYIQFIDLNTSFKIKTEPGSLGSQNLTYIIRPNPNKDPIHNYLSDENYFYDGEIITNQTTTTLPAYDKPGLYGIDVLAFNAVPLATTPITYNFKSSAWKHIPVIVKGATEKTLYFNIKDSYLLSNSTTGVKKQAYLNDLLIWEEDIAEGGTGWEYIAVDLTGDGLDAGTTPILSAINTDGTENILSFSIYMEDGISSVDVAGIFVWVDDVYIPITGSVNSDNLVKDGTCELTDAPCETCDWFITTSGTPSNTGSCGSARAGISEMEKKSGSQAIYLTVPYSPSCSYSNVASPGQIVTSMGTHIDFTDLLSCDDYWNGTSSEVGFVPLPITLTPLYTREKFYVASTITIGMNQTIEFNGCELALSPGVEIIINDGGNLKINFDDATLPIAPSHLFSCDEMWQGITVNPGGVLTIDGEKTLDDTRYCKIENAIIAVKCVGDATTTIKVPKIYLNQMSFNSNMISIELTDDNFSTSDIMQNLFECDGEYITKAPHLGYYPRNHILVENAMNVEIGSSGNQNNVFKDIYSGIRISESSVKINKGEFLDLVNHNVAAPGKGIGIIASNNTNTPYDLDIESRFSNLSRGIFSVGNFNINIHDLDYFREIDVAAISLFHFNYNNDITIEGIVNFLNTNIGILISGRNLHSVAIYDNDFTNTDFVETSTGSFHNTAITLRGVASSNGTVEVYRNNITDYRNGIHAMNLNNIRIGGDDGTQINYNNDITYNLTTSLSEEYHGIWLQNCDDADILDNTIININPTEETNLRGIVVENSDNANIGCNEIDNMGRAMQFEGFCLGLPGTQLLNNVMTDFEVGIQMETAQLSDQGSSGIPWDNEWINGANNKVDGQLLNPFQFITWYFQGTDGDVADIFVPSPRGGGLIDPKDGQLPGSLQCANSARFGNFERDLVFGPIVGDSATFEDYEEELQYAFKNYLYELLKENDSLLTLGLSTDSSFQRFYSEMDTSNIGNFSTIRQAIDSNLVDSAATLNELVTDRNGIEYSRKIVNTVLINKIMQGLDIDATDSTLLEYIFTQHWIVSGNAVYEAASILGKEYHSAEISFRKSTEAVVETKKPEDLKLDIKIYPNPTCNHVTILAPESIKYVFELRDIYNRICIQKENIKELDVSMLTNGIYTVRILVSNKVQYSGKLVIIK